MKEKYFYRAFEEKYYAPREFIKSLREQYLPFIQPLVSLYPGNDIFDIGCGRGEWLELMQEQGFKPLGVDLDEGMLDDCFVYGLPAKKGDAVEYLSTLESSSQVVVTAFHVVEHIEFHELQTLISEALRVLKPGGLLIMETPNPENIAVSTRRFYLDPTHKRPIPADLLSFMSEFYGFKRVKVLYLQESKELENNFSPALNQVIEGASPDYSVIAQKEADPRVLDSFNSPFELAYGLRLKTLASRYDDYIDQRFSDADEKVHSLNESVRKNDEKNDHIEKNVLVLSQQVEEIKKNSASLRDDLFSVYNSRSWRLTAPLRWLASLIRRFK